MTKAGDDETGVATPARPNDDSPDATCEVCHRRSTDTVCARCITAYLDGLDRRRAATSRLVPLECGSRDRWARP